MRRRPRLVSLVAAATAIGLSAAWPATADTAARRFDFPVMVTFSVKAARLLASLSERVIASASFYGDPIPSASRRADEVGRIDVGDEKALVNENVARITGSTIRRGRLNWLRHGTVEVNVNVYAARLSGPDNLLDCAFFQGPLELARRGQIRLTCKLIAEG